MAQPDAWLTVTGLQRTWSRAQSVMQKLRRWLGRRGFLGDWAYHLEPNPGSDGAHAHIWWRGDSVNAAVLAEGALASGGGLDTHATEDVFFPTGSHIPTLEYGLKWVLEDRPTEPTRLWPRAEEYLALNGGRLVNASRRFWIDWERKPVVGGVVQARVLAHTWPAGNRTGAAPACSQTRQDTKSFPARQRSGTFLVRAASTIA